MNISVVVPAYNEGKHIISNLKKILKYLKNNFDKYEVIVVEDGSKDNTKELLSKFKEVRVFFNDGNKGKGYSVKRGILKAKYDLVLFSDADLATPIYELSKFVKVIDEGYDVVIGSRKVEESDVRMYQPFFRRLMGGIFSSFVWVLAVKGFKDTQCGFKLFKTKVAKKIVRLQTLDRFAFDVEMLFLAKKFGFKVKEVGVVWINDEESDVRVVKDSVEMFVALFKIRFNNLIGRYK